MNTSVTWRASGATNRTSPRPAKAADRHAPTGPAPAAPRASTGRSSATNSRARGEPGRPLGRRSDGRFLATQEPPQHVHGDGGRAVADLGAVAWQPRVAREDPAVGRLRGHADVADRLGLAPPARSR